MDKVITIDLNLDMDVEFPTDPVLFMYFWRERIESVPKEHRSTAKVYLIPDEFSILFSITYTRPETAREERVRLECAKSKEKRIAGQDLAEYNRLKAKLGL